MDRLRVEESLAHREIPCEWSREQAVKRRRLLGRQAVDGYKIEEPLLEPRHRAELRLAHSGRARDDGLEHRLDVGRRARDHAQDFARRGSLGQRLVTLGSALFELLFERGNGSPEIAQRVIEHCHSVALSIFVTARCGGTTRSVSEAHYYRRYAFALRATSKSPPTQTPEAELLSRRSRGASASQKAKLRGKIVRRLLELCFTVLRWDGENVSLSGPLLVCLGWCEGNSRFGRFNSRFGRH